MLVYFLVVLLEIGGGALGVVWEVQISNVTLHGKTGKKVMTRARVR